MWQSLEHSPHSSVLIIGGGINGLSTARELALEGVSVTVVERGDFGSGASAGSSHMIHGGIRYLENGEVRLVRESLEERNRLLDNAAHYVSPLGTTIPIFSTFSGLLSAPIRLLRHRSRSTTERGALLIKIGLILYDLFGRKGGTLPRHEFWGRARTLEHYPQMNGDVRYTAHYSDACVHNPERLALDVLRDTLSGHVEARAVNYAEVVGYHDGQVEVCDPRNGERLLLSADVVVNASGPWVDRTNQLLGLDTSYMGGTKGSHIVVDNPALFDACRGREVFFENDDGRIVLLFPLLGKVLVGTTDIPIDNPDTAECTEEEVDYFIDLASHVFPGIPITRDQIVYRYSAVRPLPAAGDISPGVVSRDYRIVTDVLPGRQPLLSLVGGKWTTFRALGSHLARTALGVIGESAAVDTRATPIGGGQGYPRTPSEKTAWIAKHRGNLPASRVATLLERYGTIASEVIDFLHLHGDTALSDVAGYSEQEIVWIVRNEWVESLQDLTHRRTQLAFTGGLTPEGLGQLANLFAAERGVGPEEMAAQTVAAQRGVGATPPSQTSG